MSHCLKLLPIALCVLIGSFFSGPAAASCSAGPCSLVWADDFNGTAVDTSKWEFMIGNGCSYGICNWGNNEEQYYRAENATVANGELTITARQENFAGYNYTSARLRTRNLGDWTYGRFEMKARFPGFQSSPNKSTGLWPAFWMLPTSSPYGGWPSSGEIDVMEMIGQEPARIHGTIHYGDDNPYTPVNSGGSYNLPLSNPDDYHIYAVEWEDNEIRWYVDGVLFSTKNSWWSGGNFYPAPFDTDFHLLLNMAVGGNWPGSPNAQTVFPQEFVIDYVRVYQADPPTYFDDMEHGNPSSNGWFAFSSGLGGGSVDADAADLPPANGGSYSLSSSWITFSTPGNLGSFGRIHPHEVAANMSEFRMWINPDAGQDYILEINLQEDDDSDGAEDEEFQYDCHISPAGPCAIAGGGWQLVTIPLSSFYDDNSVYSGGNGVFDAVLPANAGNGELITIAVEVILNSGFDASFRTDYWTFAADADSDGIDDDVDNCTLVANAGQVDGDSDGHGNACDADLDNSCGAANFGDLVAFKSAFGTVDAAADINASGGAVNFADLVAFKVLFGATPGPSAPGALCP